MLKLDEPEKADGELCASQVTNATPEVQQDACDPMEVVIEKAGPQIVKENRGKPKKVAFSSPLIRQTRSMTKKTEQLARKKKALQIQHTQQDDITVLFSSDMVDEELHSNDGSSDEESSGNRIKYIDFNADRDMRQPNFVLGMWFCSSLEIKEAIRNYSVWKQKPIRFTTNEKYRVRAKCQGSCPWMVYASTESRSPTKDLVIKTLMDIPSDKVYLCLCLLRIL